MAEINAWQEDSAGRFIEMRSGAKKDYSIDFGDWIGGDDTLAAAVWTIPTGVTKVSEEVAGMVAKVTLLAAAVGAYLCECRITTGAGLIEIVPFRVIVE